jgi:hypothetical protein
VPDVVGNTNLYGNVSLYQTRAYLNEIRLSDKLQTGIWYYFKFIPSDDFGPGIVSDVVSGYLESIPIERPSSTIERRTVNGGRDQETEFEATTSSLVEGFKYQIRTLGTLTWTNIGLTENASIGAEFIYNGASFSPGGGRVRRVEIPVPVSEEELNRTLVVNAVTPSTLQLPTDVPEGTSSTIINRGDTDIFITDSRGEQISVVRPGDRAEIVRADDEWYDPRGNSLHLEA